MCAIFLPDGAGLLLIACTHHQAFLSQTMRVEGRNKMGGGESMSRGKQDHWQKWISSIGEKHEDDGFGGGVLQAHVQ